MNFSIFKICFLLVVVAFGVRIVDGQSADSLTVRPKVSLEAVLLKADQKELRYSLELRNGGDKAVYYSADTQNAGGTCGPRIWMDKDDASIVNVQWRVFIPSSIFAGVSADVERNLRVGLKKLETGKSVKIPISLKWPLLTTVPPLIDRSQERAVDRKEVSRIRFAVGYFDEDEGIVDFLNRKPFGWFIKGSETIDDGPNRHKRFFEIQWLAASEQPIPDLKGRK